MSLADLSDKDRETVGALENMRRHIREGERLGESAPRTLSEAVELIVSLAAHNKQLSEGAQRLRAQLRDRFATAALQGLLASEFGTQARLTGASKADSFAHDAYVLADAMLAEREKGGGK